MSYNGKHPAQLAEELDPVLSAIMTRSGLTNLSVDINIAGEPVSLAYRKGVGRVEEADRPTYAVGCVMDFIYAVICLDLHHRMGLKLDEPIDTYVHEVMPPDQPEGAPPITLQHLLTRTSGIQDPRTIEEMQTHTPWPELHPRIRAAPRLFSPGSAFNYGGIDRILLSVALLRFAKTSIATLSDEIINGPCGIDVRPEQYAPIGEDGIRRVARCDTGHLAKIAACLAAGRVEGAPTGFSEEVRTYLQVDKLQISRSIKSPPWPHAPAAFTLGLFKYSDGLVGFNGFDSGESCSLRYDPMGETGFCVGLEGPPGVRDYIVAQIAQRLGFFSSQSRAVPCTVGSLNGLRPEEIVGDYSGWASGYRADVTLDGDKVACDLTYGERRFRHIKIRMEDNAWLVVDTAAELSSLEFYRDPRTGRVCMASGGAPYAMTRTELHA
jgi:hypothetical protein